MSNVKIIITILMLLCMISAASADNWFNATLSEQFDDFETGLELLLFAIVGIYILACFLATLIGWKSHNQKLFKMGTQGFLLLIGVTILLGFAIGFFEYYVDNYW